MTINADTNLINYAIEIYPNSNDVWATKEEYGIKSDAIRLITGRPNYILNSSKTYGDNEIDINGNDISNSNNTYAYYQDLLIEDETKGPKLGINVESVTNCNLNIDFSFAIRNDTGFYSYLILNKINLNNRRCKFYTIINNVFYSAGFGETSNITKAETSIKVMVKKSYKQIDKQIPNNYTETNINEETGESDEEVIQIVLGDVDHSKLLKEELSILPISLTSTDDNVCAAIFYTWNKPQKYYEDFDNLSLDDYPYIDLYTSGLTFSENDSRIMGEFDEDDNNYPNRKWLYIKYGEKKPENCFVRIHAVKNVSDTWLKGTVEYFGYAPYYTFTPDANPHINVTRIYLEENFCDSDDKIIYSNNFNNTNYSGVLNQNKSYGKVLFWDLNDTINGWSDITVDNKVQNADTNTWWFQIVDLNCNYILSNEPETCVIQQDDFNNLIVDTYNEDIKYDTIKDSDGKVTDIVRDTRKRYQSISNLVNINPTTNSIQAKSNLYAKDETVLKFTKLQYGLKAFGVWINDNFTELVKNGYAYSPTLADPDILYNTIYNNEYGFTTFYQDDLDFVSNNIRNTTYIENPNEYNNNLFGFDRTLIIASFNVNKTIEELPDKLYFLADFVMSSSAQANCRFGELKWEAIDIYGNFMFVSETEMYPQLGNIDHKIFAYPNMSHFNFIPNDFYSEQNLNGDYYSMFDAAASSATDQDLDKIKHYFSFDKQSIDAENFLKSDIIKEIRVRFTVYSDNLFPDPWSSFKVGIKQLGLFTETPIQLSSEDIYVKVKGERCSKTSTEPNAETNSVYTSYIKLLEDYCKIDKKFIDYDDMKKKRYGWKLGRTLTERKNTIEYINDLASNSFTQLYLKRNGKLALKSFDYFNVYQQTISADTYEGTRITTDGLTQITAQIKFYEDTSKYILLYGFKTVANLPTDTYDTFVTVEGRYTDNGTHTYSLYDDNNVFYKDCIYNNAGITDGWVQMEIGTLAFTRMYFTYKSQEYLTEDVEDINIIHDKNVIVPDSLSEIEITDINNTYNNFKISYNYDENESKFIKSLSVNKVDELESFPLENTSDWQKLVVGITDSLGNPIYNDCKFVWDACKENYNIFGALQDAAADTTELNWYNNSSFDYEQAENSARLYFKLVVQWLTKQKQIINYSIPLSSSSVQLELLDLIYFNDILLTNNLNTRAFIVDKFINVKNDTVELKIMFLPEDNSDPFDTIIETGIELNTIEESGEEDDEYNEGI